MKGPDGLVQAYNAQTAVEPALQLIGGQAVTQQANDKKQLLSRCEASGAAHTNGVNRSPAADEDSVFGLRDGERLLS